jgi:hypothetical protein
MLASTEWIDEAIEGLYALEFGEALPIFKPSKTKAKGATPYCAKKYRMKAVGFVNLLCTKGYKAGKARAKVAAVYGVERATVKGWQFGLGKINHSWMQKTSLRRISNRSPAHRNGNKKMASGDPRLKTLRSRTENLAIADQRIGRAP